MKEKQVDKHDLINELDSIKYQLNGGPEHQPSIPELELPQPPAKKKTNSVQELESLIDELDSEHLTTLEQRTRST